MKKLHNALEEKIKKAEKLPKQPDVSNFAIDVKWDNISFVYTGDNVTQIILYYVGAVVKTVNLIYTGSDVTTVESIYPNGKVETIEISYSGSQLNEVTKEIV